LSGMELKTLIALVIFLLIGIVLLGPVQSYVTQVTTPSFTTVSGTVTQTVANPQYVGSTNATLVSLVPFFYVLVLLIVPAVVAYKMYRER